jgi:hypothetical protein
MLGVCANDEVWVHELHLEQTLSFHLLMASLLLNDQ